MKVIVVGIALGDSIKGNLKDGVNINVDLAVSKGTVNLYLRDGNAIWVNFSIRILVAGAFTGDYKVTSF